MKRAQKMLENARRLTDSEKRAALLTQMLSVAREAKRRSAKGLPAAVLGSTAATGAARSGSRNAIVVAAAKAAAASLVQTATLVARDRAKVAKELDEKASIAAAAAAKGSASGSASASVSASAASAEMSGSSSPGMLRKIAAAAAAAAAQAEHAIRLTEDTVQFDIARRYGAYALPPSSSSSSSSLSSSSAATSTSAGDKRKAGEAGLTDDKPGSAAPIPGGPRYYAADRGELWYMRHRISEERRRRRGEKIDSPAK